MIIHSVELEGFGCFLQRARFSFSASQPNLITGPNGSGKSTLFGALAAAFVIHHRANAEDIRRWKPWGRDLAPRVTVEFECGGTRYRLTKVFLRQMQALLEQEGPHGFAPSASGDAVEERLSGFLGGSPAPGIDARTRRWLLAGLLWVPQHQLLHTEVDEAVQESVRRTFGAQTRNPALQRILAEVERLYAQDWTPTGRARANSPLQTLPPQIEQLEEEIRELSAGLSQLETLRDRMAELERQIALLEAERARLTGSVRGLEAEDQRRSQIQADLEKKRLDKVWAEANYGRLSGILDARATLGNRRLAAQRRVEALEAGLQDASARLHGADEAFRKACEEADQHIAAAERGLEQAHAPDARELAQMERLARERAELTVKLDSALLHAEIIPEVDGRLEVLEGEPRGWMELHSLESARISGSPRIELRIPGFGRLRLSGPAESAAELRARLAEIEEAWRKLVEPYGNGGLEELRQRRQHADALALELERWRAARASHQEGRSAEAVARDAARTEFGLLQTQLAEAQGELDSLEEEAMRLQAEGRSDAEIRQELDRLALDVHGLTEAIAQLGRQMEAFPADLGDRLERLRQSAAALETNLATAREELQQYRDRLNQLQGQAIYSSLAEKQALLEQKKLDLERERLRADANRLLRTTLNAILDEAQRQVLPRLEVQVLELLDEITADFARQVALEPGSWAPRQILPAIADVQVPPAQFSGGEQEQLHLAVRLALADILTQEEPFPVVLDDAMLSTDDGRLFRILRMLEQRQGRIQWMILTCHPERFASLAGAHVIRMGTHDAAA